VAQAAFVRACELDVAVRKPGNVSVVSPGHGMHAGLFVASARAAAPALFAPRSRVGERIETAVAASWAAAGCNTNLGIVLLCAPLALAFERLVEPPTRAGLHNGVREVLAELDLSDARAAYRAIALANPGGLGTADAHDVRQPPSVGLRAAMALAADRDLIARQYRDGFDDLFTHTPPLPRAGLSLPASGAPHAIGHVSNGSPPDGPLVGDVQRVFLTLLSEFPDSHIVRKHGAAVAQNVMSTAQAFAARAARGEPLDTDPAFIAWDESLKARRVNPGTTADLTVAWLLISGLTT
jgi:triphosphoribosyl-dephospho-CoA synthase